MNFEYPLSDTAKLVVEFDYDEGQRGVHTLSNGDPGYPEIPPSIEITDVQLWVKDGPTVAFRKTGISLPEEVTNSDFLEEQAWAVIDNLRAQNEENE